MSECGACKNPFRQGGLRCPILIRDRVSAESNPFPESVRCERDWRCLQLAGPIPFSPVGVLASLVQPLAEAGICVFAISTFDTDYLFVKAADLARATDAWP